MSSYDSVAPTNDRRERFKVDQSMDRARRRDLARQRAKLGPTPRGPQGVAAPTDEMKRIDAEVRRLTWAIRARLPLLRGEGVK